MCVKIHITQFSCSVTSQSLWPHGLQHARLPCLSPTPRACSNSCPFYITIHSQSQFDFNLSIKFVIQPIKHINAYMVIFKINKCIYLFLADLGLCCCKGFSPVSESRSYSLVVHGLVIMVASLVAWAWALGPVGFISCIPWAVEHRLSSQAQ